MSSLYEVVEKIKILERDQKILKDAVEKNTAITLKSAADTEEILAVLDGAKAAIQFLIILGRIAKWIAGICVAVGSVWALIYAFQSGHPPALGK